MFTLGALWRDSPLDLLGHFKYFGMRDVHTSPFLSLSASIHFPEQPIQFEQ